MAVIVANVYQQAAMCVTEKHRAPRWLTKFTLNYMSPLLHMEDKVKAVLSQTVRVQSFDWIFLYEKKKKTSEIDDAKRLMKFTSRHSHYCLSFLNVYKCIQI